MPITGSARQMKTKKGCGTGTVTTHRWASIQRYRTASSTGSPENQLFHSKTTVCDGTPRTTHMTMPLVELLIDMFVNIDVSWVIYPNNNNLLNKLKWILGNVEIQLNSFQNLFVQLDASIPHHFWQRTYRNSNQDSR